MNIICKIFGHRFIATILDTKINATSYYYHTLEEPMCKRCGLTRNEIVKATADNNDLTKSKKTVVKS